MLLEATANPAGPGLLLRGLEHGATPLTRAALDEGSALAVAADGLVRLARLAEDAAERLRDHPDAPVRRAAALLAARAHPLRAGLEQGSGPTP